MQQPTTAKILPIQLKLTLLSAIKLSAYCAAVNAHDYAELEKKLNPVAAIYNLTVQHNGGQKMAIF